MTCEEFLIKHGCAFVAGSTPAHFIEAMKDFAEQESQKSYVAAINKQAFKTKLFDDYQDYRTKNPLK